MATRSPSEPTELLPVEPLRDFLDAAGIGSGDLEVEAIAGGHSNLTFSVRRGEQAWVLRRPPRPPYPPSAHDVIREAELLRQLGTHTPVPVPEILVTCRNEAVIGVPFVVMSFVPGVVLADVAPTWAREEKRGRIPAAFLDTLAEVHRVDWRAARLENLGRPSGYLKRQLRRFAMLWQEHATRPVPDMDIVVRWLDTHRPESEEMTLVHGDARLGNALFAPDEPARVLALLDWEMATIGDPLADVGYFLATYAVADEAPNPITDLCAMTRAPGFPSRQQLAQHYADVSGREVDRLHWYQVLALWKAAVFLEASYRRWLQGRSDDEFFASLGAGVPLLAEAARRTAESAAG